MTKQLEALKKIVEKHQGINSSPHCVGQEAWRYSEILRELQSLLDREAIGKLKEETGRSSGW